MLRIEERVFNTRQIRAARSPWITVALLTPVFLGAAIAARPSLAAEKIRLAVFDLELNDASLEGEMGGARKDQTARITLISDALREALAAQHAVELVDTQPQSAEIEKSRPLLRCNGCGVKIARSLAADQLLMGEVYKVSNLIIDINLYVLDAKTGKATQFVSTSIRNNTDESWLRGVRYLATKRLKFEQK